MQDSADTIAAYATEMSGFLKTSEITETRSFVRSFVKTILVRPGRATIHYAIPTPPDSPLGGADAAEVALSGRVNEYGTCWWAMKDSNLRPPGCKPDALAT